MYSHAVSELLSEVKAKIELLYGAHRDICHCFPSFSGQKIPTNPFSLNSSKLKHTWTTYV